MVGRYHKSVQYSTVHKVVYDHTSIASYRHGVQVVQGYLLLMVGVSSELGVCQVTPFCPVYAKQRLCAAEAIFCCSTENSHRLKS